MKLFLDYDGETSKELEGLYAPVSFITAPYVRGRDIVLPRVPDGVKLVLIVGAGLGKERPRAQDILDCVVADMYARDLFVFTVESVEGVVHLMEEAALVAPPAVSGERPFGLPATLLESDSALLSMRDYMKGLLSHAEPVSSNAARMLLEDDLLARDDPYSEVFHAIAGRPPKQIGQPEEDLETEEEGMTEDVETSAAPEEKGEWGTLYVLEDDKPDMAYDFFNRLVAEGMNGLVISREKPDTVMAERNVPGEASIFWLSRTDDPMSLTPTNLGKLAFNITQYMKTTPNSVVLLDGLGTLISSNGFANTARWLDDLEESVILTNSILILPLNPEALDRKELKLIEMHRKKLTPAHIKAIGDFTGSAPGGRGTAVQDKGTPHVAWVASDSAVDVDEHIYLGHPYIVMTDEDGNPLVGVTVEARCDGRYVDAITDIHGRAVFRDLEGDSFPKDTRFFASKPGYRSQIWDIGILSSGTVHPMVKMTVDDMMAEAEAARDRYDYSTGMMYLHMIHREDRNNSKYWFYRKQWIRELKSAVEGVDHDPNCEVCNGDGVCNLCEGSSRCQHCNEGVCAECGGTGIVNGEVCHVCSGTGLCAFCDGSGICSHCFGTGACNECTLPRLQYECTSCGEYIYRPWVGDPEGGVDLWTPFEDIKPDKWRCPVCGAGKEAFVRLTEKDKHV